MKHLFKSSRGHTLEIRQSSNATKLFLVTEDKGHVRLDDKQLKPAIVTAILQEIINIVSLNKQKSESFCPCGSYYTVDHKPEICDKGYEILSLYVIELRGDIQNG